jgi:hypothetical protein
MANRKKNKPVPVREVLAGLLSVAAFLLAAGLFTGHICDFSLKNSQEGNELQVKACQSKLPERDPVPEKDPVSVSQTEVE